MARKAKDTEEMRIAAAMISMGATRPEIEKRLDRRQSTVSTLLSDAVELGWLTEWHWEKSDDDRRRYAMSKELGTVGDTLKALAAKEQKDSDDPVNYWPGYGTTPPAIYPYYSHLSGNPTPTPADWCGALRDWAKAGVSEAVLQLLTSGGATAEGVAARRIGIGWGRHIRALHDAMKAVRPRDTGGGRPLDFIPLMGARNQMLCEKGDTVYTNPYALSSNELAFDFDRLFNTGRPPDEALERHIPGINFIPFDESSDAGKKTGTAAKKGPGPANRPRKRFPFVKHLTGKELAAERADLEDLRQSLFGAFPAYVETFGLNGVPPKPLCAQLDGIIAAVGDAKAPLVFGPEGMYAGVQQDWFLAHTVGDIASVQLLRGEPPLDAKPVRPAVDSLVRQQFERFQSRWMGVTERHIRKCADRRRAGNGVGVIVLAVGSSRAEVVLECIRRGLVNHLFADYSLLDAIRQLAEGKLTGKGK